MRMVVVLGHSWSIAHHRKRRSSLLASSLLLPHSRRRNSLIKHDRDVTRPLPNGRRATERALLESLERWSLIHEHLMNEEIPALELLVVLRVRDRGCEELSQWRDGPALEVRELRIRLTDIHTLDEVRNESDLSG